MRRRWLIGGVAVVVILVVALGVVFYQRSRRLVFAVVPKSVSDPYFEQAGQGCRDEARRLRRVTCEFVGPETVDAAAQVQILEGLIARGRALNGLAVAPIDSRRVVPVLKKAADAGIRVVTFDTDAPRASGRLAFVGTEGRAAGIQLATLLTKLAPSGATYAILTGDPGADDLNLRIEGIHAYLKQLPAYKEVAGSPIATQGTPARARAAVTALLQSNPKLTAIVMVGPWALLDAGGYKKALGTRAADAKAGKLVVVGFDMFEPELQLVKEGYVAGLIGQRPYQMGGQSVRLLYELATQKIEPPKNVYHSGVRIVTKENVSFFLR